MKSSFTEMLLFQVHPDKIKEFEMLIKQLKEEQAKQTGCIDIRYFKRLYTFDGVEYGDPPREIMKIIKCVKYFGYWEFDTIENCGKANGWLFENFSKDISKLLVVPFDISSGYSV